MWGYFLQNLFATVLVFLEERLGSAYTEKVAEGWQAVAGVLLGVIKDQLVKH